MLQNLLAFRSRHQPYMVRGNYRHEMRSALTFPLAASLAEGSFTGVVAAKYFHATPTLIAVITAAPMFGNIFALLWAHLARGRPRVRFVNILQGAVVLTLASVAATCALRQPFDGWLFAAQVVLVRILASGIATVRSDVWRANYPRHLRGQIVSRITVVATAVLALATWLGSRWLDHNPHAFVYLYPGAAALGALGIHQFSRVRVRRERRLLTTSRPAAQGPPAPSFLFAFFSQARRILRDDPQFRAYQRWQFLSGFSFMMFGPSLLFMVSKEMTNPTTQYQRATLVLQIIPMVISLLCTQLWAPLFDRVHITRFRVTQTAVSVVAQLTLFAGAMLDSLALVAVAQALVGISNAGGNLAWNLGHNDFARGQDAGTYMGVHVMLTGLRGCIAPFFGAFLYQSPYVGRWIFLASTAVCFCAFLGFYSMSKNAPTRPDPSAPLPEPEPVTA